MKNCILKFVFIICCCAFLGLESGKQFRVYLIGDSTMADKPLVDNPEHGWGQMLPLFFSQNVIIKNYALNGRSTKSFISEGNWQKVCDQLQRDDYVLIQFGHNDSKKEDTMRYAAPHTVFKDNLKKIIYDARGKYAIPILLTPITRRDFDSIGCFKGSHGEYPDVIKETGREENVPLIDMFGKSKLLLQKLGDEQSKELYLAGVKQNEFRSWNKKKDNTHFTRKGAVKMASLAVEGIKELQLPIANELIFTDVDNLAGEGKVVGLDYFFNNEWKMSKDSVPGRWHYVFEETTDGGFSVLGRIIDQLGADLDTLQSAPTDSQLSRLSVYIIVDPDTPKEIKNPNYVNEEHINAIERWVKNGGVLVLMENNKGNAEFEHFNKLSERFGIHFNEDNHHMVTGKAYETGRNDNLPAHPIFKDVKQIFMKEISSLRIENPAEAILAEDSLVLMAVSRAGKGLVFAVGDPWLYNEYIDNRRLPPDYENYKAARNLFRWLLNQAVITKK